jgi:PAS domain S-box-containing protein
MSTILVVDDRPVDREFMATLLRYRGHGVLEAADGEEALARARAERPDLVVADLLMPRMDGFRLVRELRSDPELARIAIMIYSASYDSLQVRDLTKDYGATVLARPSEPQAILEAVEAVLTAPPAAPALPPEEFDRRHLRILGDKLYEKAKALEESNRQLTRLVAELRAEVENRRRAEAEAAEQREWLRVVLTSIGDALIATDDQGSVSFLNPVAESMTGWPRAEAVSRQLDEVFRIINEHDRGPVESPVARVLREGLVVGLANHTVLIGRDGTERPIDDSGAPIRDADDHIRGVVLVFHDVSARRELERQLRDRAERLAEAYRRKDDFLAMLAHELRNPLAPIRNSLYVLEVSSHDPQVVEEMRDIMRRQIEHLVCLVDDLLDVSRITRGLIALRKERVDLVKIVRQSLIDHRRRAELSGLMLTDDLPDGPIWLDADPIRLKQAVDNLLGYALKFTDRGGAVMVTVAAVAAEEASLSIRDTGIGIDEEILPRIFEPFAQADRSLDRSRGGLGLGLALVRGLIELHGGSVQARSEGLGRGSEFTVRLRIGAAPTPVAEALPEAPTAPTRHRVLVIEDHRDSAETLRRILALHGYDVAVAHEGADGIAEVTRSRPDVVLCDIGLPGMDGYAVASALRAEPAGARARLIALSGYGRAEDLQRARAASFDDHIVKPADPDELIRKIEGRG